MDGQGYRARRRAAHSEALYANPHRGSDGRFMPVESAPQPVEDSFVGGFAASRPLTNGAEDGGAWHYRDDTPPWASSPYDGPQTDWSDHEQPRPSPNAFPIPQNGMPQDWSDPPPAMPQPQFSRQETTNGAPLRVVCGPLLRYDTVDAQKIWHGAVMIVTADHGSIYEPPPMITLEWVDTTGRETRPGKLVLPGQDILQYRGSDDSYTFWRFLIEIPLGQWEVGVTYSINRTAQVEFFVPGAEQNMRWAAHSCNGFSAGVQESNFCSNNFKTGNDPVWVDLLNKHEETPFHVLVGGGDQIYCDRLTLEPEMQDWLHTKNPATKMAYPLTEEMKDAMDRFYFNHYCKHFREGSFAQANRSIPMLNMLDDHDLIDGFGSYPDDLQSSPVFSTIGSRGYFWFLAFQLFVVDGVDGTIIEPGEHTFKATIIGGPGSFIPFPNHSMLSYLGPQVYMLLLDCRAERKKVRVCSDETYEKAFLAIRSLPPGVEHLVILLGIPIAYPRMNFMEKTLHNKYNPLVMLGAMALGGFLNKFNSEVEILDDLNDHWTADGHKHERNWFIIQCQRIALERRLRVSFVSGDVHCAAVGAFMTLNKGGRHHSPLAHEKDHRYMLNVVTSAIVNAPPHTPVLTMVNKLSEKRHKTMHDVDTDETMLPIFATAPNGSSSRSKYIFGARNWTNVVWDERTGELVFDLRLEKERGRGVTVGYPVRAPRPLWL